MASGEPKWYMDMVLSKGNNGSSFNCPHCNQPISLDISQGYNVNAAPFGVGMSFEPLDKLPEVLDIGKSVRINSPGFCWDGRIGKITDHYICGDDCSGHFRRAKYEVEDKHGNRCSFSVLSCEILD